MSRRLCGLAVGVALMLAACSDLPPVPTESPAATGPVSTGPQENLAKADTIVVVADGSITNLTNAAADVPTVEAISFLHVALYQYNADLEPVPDLTDGPCTVSDDGLEWTCTLLDGATFHNGAPITADDVVLEYQIAASPNCRFDPSVCLSAYLESVEATDDRTVVFRIGQKDENGELFAAYAPFETSILPRIIVEPADVIQAQFEDLWGAVEDLTPEEVGAAIGAITGDDPMTDEDDPQEGFEVVPPDADGCDTAVVAAEALLRTAMVELPDRADFETADPDPESEGEEGERAFDPCAYGGALVTPLSHVLATLRSDGIDALAAAYPLLPLNRQPVGAGPWMCEPGCLEAGHGLSLVAHEAYHAGAPETPNIFMPIISDDVAGAEAVAAGRADWKYSVTGDSHAAIQDSPSVRFIEYPEFGYFALMFNVREGQLFSDVNLRKAVQLCVDKAATVEAATQGQGVPIESGTPPGSWSFNPTIEPVERDVAAGIELVESSGWTVPDENGDGLADSPATRDGETLSTDVFVRPGRPDRVAFMELVRDQVIECGIEFEVVEPHIPLLPLLEWPHIPPGADEAWDAYFGGWGTALEPDPYALWHCDQRTSPEQVSAFNFIGFCNERVDDLIEQGRTATDRDERREIYWELQEILAEEQPYYFAWSDLAREAIDVNFDTTGEPLDESSPMWHWQLEDLYIRE